MNQFEQKPDWESISLEDAARLIDERVEKAKHDQRERLEKLVPGESSRWLALAPAITVPLAEAAGLPAGRGGAREAIELLSEKGLLQSSGTPQEAAPEETPTVYWMPNATRLDVLGDLVDDRKKVRELRSLVARVGKELSRAASRSKPVPATVTEWAALAERAQSGDAMVALFEERVSNAFDKRDAVTLLSWIEAARPLADLLARQLDTALELALVRAGRRLELLHRRALDERYVRTPTFLVRTDQVDALKALVSGPDDLWALHLYGIGGVGKTMILRYLSALLAPDEFKAATARIDFDYLSADYPRLDPGLLLWSFAQELRAYDSTGRSTELFDKADRLLRDLKQSPDPAKRATDNPRFVDACGTFLDALRALEMRVILVVDTCEELAKIRPDGTVPENVEETFRILRALHDGPQTLGGGPSGYGLRSLRVVFAGRRPLARQGNDWQCKSSSQPPRPYLRMHELRGFDHDESVRYLRDGEQIPADLVEPCIRQCPDPGAPAVIEYDDARRAPAGVERFNPYELRLYAQWAKEQPPPSAETIAKSSAAQYVELRILNRLEKLPALERMMPVLALLKHVDRPLIDAILQDEESGGVVFERLQQQEWIDQRVAATADGTETRVVLSVEENLRRRLWLYFSERGGFAPDLVKRAADYLAQVTLNEPLGSLDWTVFDAGVRALGVDVARACQWWQQVERRIVGERDFVWLRDVTGSLIAEKNAAGPAELPNRPTSPPVSPLRAYVMASYASALARTDPASMSSWWQEVHALAQQLPESADARRLRSRALAGVIAGSSLAALRNLKIGELWSAFVHADQVGILDAELSASLVAAAENVTEVAEISPDGLPGDDPEDFELFAKVLAQRLPQWSHGSPAGPMPFAEMSAFSASLAGRAFARARKYDESAQWFATALNGIPAASTVPHAWRDWIPPEDVRGRIRIEAVRALYPAKWSAADALNALGSLPSPAGGDGDRLYTVFVRLLQHLGTAAERATPVQLTWLRDPTFSLPAPARCNAHREVPPLAVAKQELLADSGYPHAACEALRQIITSTRATDLAVARHADRALSRLVLRLRLRDEGDRTGGTLTDSGLSSDRALIWASEAQDGLKNAEPIPSLPEHARDGPAKLEWLHAIWSTHFARSGDRARDLILWADDKLPYLSGSSELPSYEVGSVLLDIAEAISLQLAARVPAELATRPIEIDEWWSAHPDAPVQALTLALRAIALGNAGPRIVGRSAPGWDAKAVVEPAERLGLRRAAYIALDEGDLLALRLPRQAAALFEQAERWFAASNDPVGAALAAMRRAAIALAASPNAGQTVDAALAAYAVLPRVLDQWAPPPASELAAISANPTAQALDALPRTWRPWLIRLLAAVHAQASWRVASAETEQLHAWIREHYGARAGDAWILPADLEPLLERSPDFTREAAAPEMAAPPPPSRARGFLRGLGTILSAGLGFVIIAGVVVAGFRGFRWWFDQLYGSGRFESLNRFVQLGLYAVGVPTVIVAIVQAFRRVRSAWASLLRARVNVEFVESGLGYRSTSLASQVRVSAQLARPRIRWFPWPQLRRTVSPPVTSTVTGTGVDPYGTGAQALAAREVGAALRKATAHLRDRSIRVEVVPAKGLHGPAWEAFLELATSPAAEAGSKASPASQARGHLRCRRVANVTRSRQVAIDRPRVVSIACDATGERVASSVWTYANRVSVEFVGQLTDPQPSVSLGTLFTERARASQLVHTIGFVEETHSGPAFVIGADTAVKGTRAAYGRLITADELAVVFHGLAVAVIQGQPLATWAARLQDDRRAAISLRAFAGALFEAGVGGVVVIPRLETALAHEALSRLAGRVAKRGEVGELLARYTADLQKLILKRATLDVEDRWEVALDVCYYAAPWNEGLFASQESSSKSEVPHVAS